MAPTGNYGQKTVITRACLPSLKFSYHKPLSTPPAFLTHLPPLLKTTTALRRQVRGLSPLFSAATVTTTAPTDVIIVGAGVAGSALAWTLAKDGRRVHVIEKDLREPERIIGEVLQPGGYLKLLELGLEDCLEQIDAQRTLGMVTYKDEKKIKMDYPLKKFSYDLTGRTFLNGRFVQRMREKASTLENVRMEQGTVTSLVKQNNKTVIGVQYKTKDGQELTAYAPLTVVCDGGFSTLRQSLCHTKVEVTSYTVGVILENCQLPLENYLHLIIGDPSFITFYRVNSTSIRCAVDILSKASLGGIANYLKTKVASQIPKELHDSFISAIDSGNIKIMPNSNLPTDPYPTTSGALLLGDAFNMRHSLTGAGMTVALSDVVVLRDLLKPICDLNDSTSLGKCLESFYILRKPMASIMNILADSLHKIITVTPMKKARKELGQVTLDYLELGEFFSSGMLSLITGLNPNPWSLVLILSANMLYGVGRLILPFPSFERLRDGARLVSSGSELMLPLIKAEGVRQTFFPASIPTFCKAPSDRLKEY
ncbi:hypothetical protein Fmac_026724 [Flemingia macrophylla]|uniref:Squalene monooxygenase n=1 Tax=Flemingia macrophylla TaxID=520843 RepID=A0ABD1LFM8_9FABA